MRGMKKCASKMQSITAENILLLAHRGTLAKLFARYLLTLCAVSQSLLLLKGSGVLYPMIWLPERAPGSFSVGGDG